MQSKEQCTGLFNFYMAEEWRLKIINQAGQEPKAGEVGKKGT